eukprot:UN34575
MCVIKLIDNIIVFCILIEKSFLKLDDVIIIDINLFKVMIDVLLQMFGELKQLNVWIFDFYGKIIFMNIVGSYTYFLFSLTNLRGSMRTITISSKQFDSRTS